jgi:hypothetical protein
VFFSFGAGNLEYHYTTNRYLSLRSSNHNTGLLNIGNDSHIIAIVVDSDDPNVVYAATGGYRATDGQSVFKSIDGGKNWTVFNDGLGASNIRSLALAPGSPNVQYAATPAGVFKIIDGPVVTLNEICAGVKVLQFERSVNHERVGNSPIRR